MRTLKNILSALGALVPVIYCGHLIPYFMQVGGSVQGVQDVGLGPTVIGLGAVGVFFFLVFVWRVRRIFAEPRTPGSSGRKDRGARDDDDGFDADAAIARYMAQRPVAAGPSRPVMPSRPKGGKPTGFGRRA